MLNDRGHSITNIRFEMPWVARQPVENDGAISPGISIVEGQMKNFIDMVEKLSKKVCTTELQTRNGQALDFGIDDGDVP